MNEYLRVEVEILNFSLPKLLPTLVAYFVPF
jgi:hypothetical protein